MHRYKPLKSSWLWHRCDGQSSHAHICAAQQSSRYITKTQGTAPVLNLRTTWAVAVLLSGALDVSTSFVLEWKTKVPEAPPEKRTPLRACVRSKSFLFTFYLFCFSTQALFTFVICGFTNKQLPYPHIWGINACVHAPSLIPFHAHTW